MTVLRVLIDTNVLVSAVLSGGRPAAAIDAARAGTIYGIVSLHILAEFRDVLARPRFAVEAQDIDALVDEIAAFAEVSPVERADRDWCEDPDDDPVVEAALQACANVVVTGDRHLLRLDSTRIRFVTPAVLLGEIEGAGSTRR